MKKKDEEKRWTKSTRNKICQMIKSADGRAGFVHKNHQVPKRGEDVCRFWGEEDAKPLTAKRRVKSGRSIGNATRKCNVKENKKPLRKEELKKSEEDFPKLEESDFAKAARIYKTKNMIRMRCSL